MMPDAGTIVQTTPLRVVLVLLLASLILDGEGLYAAAMALGLMQNRPEWRRTDVAQGIGAVFAAWPRLMEATDRLTVMPRAEKLPGFVIVDPSLDESMHILFGLGWLGLRLTVYVLLGCVAALLLWRVAYRPV